MIKKIFFTMVLISLTFSCGKKGDPVYNGKIQNIDNTKLLMVS